MRKYIEYGGLLCGYGAWLKYSVVFYLDWVSKWAGSLCLKSLNLLGSNLFGVLSIHEIPWIHYLFVLFTILFGLCLKHPSPFVTLYINSNEFELSIKDSNWAQINPKLSLNFLIQLSSNLILIINIKTNTNSQLNYSILLSTTQKVQPKRKIR